jgi:hypothetical protein
MDQVIFSEPEGDPKSAPSVQDSGIKMRSPNLLPCDFCCTAYNQLDVPEFERERVRNHE